VDQALERPHLHRSLDGRSEHHGQRQQQPEEGHHEREGLDIIGAGRSVLHAITPEATGSQPVVKA
jgi:hypothetical protein